MTDEEYTEAMDALGGLARTIRLLPLREMSDDLHRVEGVAWFLDPTRYGIGGGRERLAEQRRLLDAALNFRRAVDAMVADAGGDAMTERRRSQETEVPG